MPFRRFLVDVKSKLAEIVAIAAQFSSSIMKNISLIPKVFR